MRLFLSVAFLLALSTAGAQTFLTYSIKGNVTAVENNKTIPVKIGMMFNEVSQVVVPAGGAVTFICNEINLVTLSKAGKYNLSLFKDSCKVNSSSMTLNYLKYVWNQLTTKPGTPEKNRKYFMSNIGAASRSINNIWIDPRLDTINYYSGSFPLSWKSYAEAEEFEFQLFDKNAEVPPVFSVFTKSKYYPASEINKVLKPGNTYYWTASVKGEQNNERKVLRVVTKDEFDSFLNKLGQADPAFESEAEKAFRTAFLLEQGHYLAEAYTYYLKAASLQPDAGIYKNTLEAFMKDYNIVDK